MHKSQLLFVILCCFVGGVTAGSFLAFSQTTLYLFFIPPLLLVGIFWRRNWKIVFIAFSAAIFLFGVLRTFDSRLSTSFVQKFANGNYVSTVSGYIDGEIKNTGKSQQFVFRVKKLELPDFTVPEKLDEEVLVITKAYPVYHYGDQLSLKGKISLPQNYNDFDYISYLAKDQIFTIMFQPEVNRPGAEIALPDIASLVSRPFRDLSLSVFFEDIKIGFYRNIFKLKSRFEESVGLAVKEPNASLINGILLGSRQDIPQDLKNDFAAVSVSHILAISGYNITIVAQVISWLLLFFMKRNKAFWFSAAAIFIFTILTGASASVVRSALMGGLVLLANHSGRLYNSKNTLALVAFLMVLLNPMILRYDIGFQLSFLATLGLLYVAPVFKPYFKKWPDFFNLKETFLLTLSAQLSVLPLIVFYFKNFSLVSLPANLLVLPLIPAAMLFGFLTGLAGMIWVNLGFLVGALAWLISSLVIILVKFFASLPHASLQFSINWQVMLVAYALIAWFLFYLKKNKTAE